MDKKYVLDVKKKKKRREKGLQKTKKTGRDLRKRPTKSKIKKTESKRVRKRLKVCQ